MPDGFYWVLWTGRPSEPQVSERISSRWWFGGLAIPIRDYEVRVLSERLEPPPRA